MVTLCYQARGDVHLSWWRRSARAMLSRKNTAWSDCSVVEGWATSSLHGTSRSISSSRSSSCARARCPTKKRSLDFVVKATQIFTRARQLALGDDALVRRVERAKLPLLYVKCVRGPEFFADDFPRVVGAFERIAKENKVQFLQEGPADFESKLTGFRAKISK